MVVRLFARLAMLLVPVSAAAAQPTPSTPPAPPPPAAPLVQPAKPEQAPVTEKPAPDLKRLMVGDKAPPLAIEAWVKGAAVPKLEAGKVYVVEFWATWCAPCKLSIPHLTELQAKFKDKGVTVIGVASQALNDGLETAASPQGESVRHFVGQMGDKMGYTVAWDDKGSTNRNWFEASHQDGIPAAFLVNKEGVVAWIGNPMFPEKELDTALEQVVEGKFDLAAATAKAKKDAEIEEKANKLLGEANDLWMANKQREAADKLDEVVMLDPERYGDLAIQKFGVLVVSLKEPDAGYAYANKLIDGVFKNNAIMLNSLAWTILTGDGIEKRDYAIAKRAALRANELKAGREPAMLDTLATAYFGSGEFAKAVETEAKALELTTDPEVKAELTEKLATYRKADQTPPGKTPEKAPKGK